MKKYKSTDLGITAKKQWGAYSVVNPNKSIFYFEKPTGHLRKHTHNK